MAVVLDAREKKLSDTKFQIKAFLMQKKKNKGYLNFENNYYAVHNNLKTSKIDWAVFKILSLEHKVNLSKSIFWTTSHCKKMTLDATLFCLQMEWQNVPIGIH